ncbi:GMC family oxidoreductase [Nocardia goodfellowii]|uniref:Choline dehydrogenase n=1 Tax=Nocardia goodfellowii TaxID=882446 RepID=A0ABS4QIP3_9NOCA|nr:GMC family oxidoreductase N-terminal domain-containing protein [Nocardia goodfellowii]MBP2191583.1 choline dehydrogenase [Nocardia goodfellowii]
MSKTFDYIVVGAGSAGCALAGRLAEDGTAEVALLEAGATDRKLLIRMPSGFAKMLKTPYDWNYSTTPQTHLRGRSLYWPRGRVLGGTSAFNGQVWSRCHRDDYDGWELPGWTFSAVEPYFRRAEQRRGGNETGHYGKDGPMRVCDPRVINPTTTAFLDAGAEAGFPRLADLNLPANDGFCAVAVNQRRGRRWSSADGYLGGAWRRRNLTILKNVQARRVLFSDSRAIGVEVSNRHGRIEHITAGKEVILSAGTIGSPQLLMLSGVGDPDHLRDMDIPLVHAAPEVGGNLQDHLSMPMFYHCPQPVTLASASTLANAARYQLLRRGPLASNLGEGVGFVRTRDDLSAPDCEIVWVPGAMIRHGFTPPAGHGITMLVQQLQPRSRGRITLTDNDIVVAPDIDPRYLSAESDLDVLRAGVRLAERVVGAAALRPYIAGPMAPWPGAVGDAELTDMIRRHAETAYHPVGTCRMGADPDSVVDPELQVRGVDGLRVADASVIPTIPRGHTHAPAVMIAERAADFIRGRTVAQP